MKKYYFVMVLILAVGVQAELKSGQIIKYNDADTNGDGKLCKEEFNQVVKQRYEDQGKSGWEVPAEKQFKNKDQNEDGFLTVEEFWSVKKK